jgi:hypothetical protein
VSRFDPDEPPEDLTDWLKAGFRRTDAIGWRRWNFDLLQAQTWHRAGVRDPLAAAQWSAAAVTPATVKDWMAAGVTSSEAVRWNEFGYGLTSAREAVKKGLSPESVFQQRSATASSRIGGMARASRMHGEYKRFLDSGVPHNVLSGYFAANWTDDEALAWARVGIQAVDARVWIRLGMHPSEVDGLSDPLVVIEEWWRAGIPFDELSDWLGAGLSAAEAVEQRKSGVTQEQAAALRALRRGGSL